MLCKIIKLLLLGGWGGGRQLFEHTVIHFPLLFPKNKTKQKKPEVKFK